jgi:hypothetical protein
MMSRPLPLFVIGILSSLSLAGATEAVTIDDFSVGPIVINGSGAVGSQTGLDNAHVIGGNREIRLESAGQAQVETMKGRFHFTTATGSLGYYKMMYGLNQPLGVDFTAHGHDRIRYRFIDGGTAGIFWTYVNSQLPPNSNGLDIGNAFRAINGRGVIEVPYALYQTNFTNVSTFAIHIVRMESGAHHIDEILTAGPPLAGDFNRDGQVDSDDYYEWRRLNGKTIAGGILLGPDGNADGRVDAADYVVWRKRAGSAGVGSTSLTTVPEPSIEYWLAAAILTLVAFRRRTPWLI